MKPAAEEVAMLERRLATVLLSPLDYNQLPGYNELVFFYDDAHMVELPVIDDGEFELLG
jgi:hypothetical protein